MTPVAGLDEVWGIRMQGQPMHARAWERREGRTWLPAAALIAN